MSCAVGASNLLTPILVYIAGKIVPRDALLDTGANVSLLSAQAAVELKVPIFNLAEPVRLITVGGFRTIHHYAPAVRIGLGKGPVYPVEFLISRDLHVPILVGRDAIPATAVWKFLASLELQANMAMSEIIQRILTPGKRLSSVDLWCAPLDDDEYNGLLHSACSFDNICYAVATDESAILTTLGLTERTPLQDLVREYIACFRAEVSPTLAKVEPMLVKLRSDELSSRLFEAPRFRSAEEKAEIEKQISEMLRLGIIIKAEDTTDGWSQIHLVRKANGSWRYSIYPTILTLITMRT
jgi:hypothetical protein